MMEIELIQGDDSPVYKFQRKDKSGNVITTLPKEMWITFKESCCHDDCLFQKKLTSGDITFDATDNYYKFQISSDETHALPYGIYGFDIAIRNEKDKKTTLLPEGRLVIVKHYTKKCNEG